ncbi:MAG TPA: DUF4832 domain-containing protein [bacterium]|jgi:hypothetical protein|nr:DUF4832 domain-containing protein [bacterium]
MKRILAIVIFLVFGVFPAAIHAGTVNYTVDGTTDFSNPERGWYVTMYCYGNGISQNNNFSNANWQGQVTGSGNVTGDTNQVVVKRIYDLGGIYGGTDYATSGQPIDATWLNNLTNDLNTARSLGVKLILRFDYNEGVGTGNSGNSGGQDASLSVIQGHIGQIFPILAANEDVIAYIEAGFIGQWGEWHDSTNGLTNSGNTNSTSSEGSVLSDELADLPSDRMIAVRYPGYTVELYNTLPVSPAGANITVANAFNGSDYSRLGTHDDCFESDQYDSGTYEKGSNLGWSVAQFKSFLDQQNYSVQEGGETCGVDSGNVYSPCANSVTDLTNEHWSAMHCEWDPSNIDEWKSGGCLPTINTGLGYRYALTQSVVPASVNTGATLNLSLTVENNGWANCYNQRGMEVILRPLGDSGFTGAVAIPVAENTANNTDPRFWQPGHSYTASISVTVPLSVAAGSYDVLLNLPDGHSSLYNSASNPAAYINYALRLADTGVWESADGYNNLSQTLSVVTCAGCTPTLTPTVSATPTATTVPPCSSSPSLVGTAVISQTGTEATSWTVAYTAGSGSDTMLVANVELFNATGAKVGSISYNGTPLLKAVAAASDTGGPGGTDMETWYLMSPSTSAGAGLVILPAAGAYADYEVAVMTFSGTAGIGTSIAQDAINNVSTYSTSITPSGNNSLLESFLENGGQTVSSGTPALTTIYSDSTYDAQAILGTTSAGPATGGGPYGLTYNFGGAVNPGALQLVEILGASCGSPTDTPQQSPTESPSQSPSLTATRSATATATISPSATPSPSPSVSRSATPSRTASLSPTLSPSRTMSGTASATASESPSETLTPFLSPTPSSSATPKLSATDSPTPTPSPSQSPSATASASASPSPSGTPTPSATGSPSASATASPYESPTSSFTPTPYFSPTASPTPTSSASVSPSASPSATPSVSPSRSPSPSATPPFSPTPTASVTLTATESATAAPQAPGQGPNAILATASVPDPNPVALKVLLAGDADSVTMEIYTTALVRVGTGSIGASQAGWVNLPLPYAFVARAANGLYYYRIISRRGSSGSKPAVGKFLILH